MCVTIHGRAASHESIQLHLFKQQIHTWKELWFPFRKKSVVSGRRTCCHGVRCSGRYAKGLSGQNSGVGQRRATHVGRTKLCRRREDEESDPVGAGILNDFLRDSRVKRLAMGEQRQNGQFEVLSKRGDKYVSDLQFAYDYSALVGHHDVGFDP